jgi:hypothetical protein
MAFFIPILAAVGGGSAMAGAAVALSAVSAVAGGYAQSKQLKAQAQADQYNALVGRQKSEATLSAANQQEEQQRRVARLASGERRAAIAQSGAGLGGSNADIDRQSEVMAELDSLNIRYSGQLQSTGLLNQSNLDEASARNNKKAAKSAVTMGYVGAATKLLTAGA